MGYEFDGVVYERLRDMQAARRARYVQLLESGMNFTQAALAVDVSKRTGKVWRNGRTRSSGRDERPLVDWYAGRMKANSGHGPASGSTCYLSEDERIEIADLLQAGESVRAIARRLGRSPSTISHELRRNAYPGDGGYRPRRAHQLASERRARPKERKIRKGTKLYDYVAAGLKRHWSPEQIGRRMLLDFPDNEDMRACHETIYVQGKGELRRDLARALCKGRATRYTILLALPDGHDAEHVQQAIIAKMKTLPKPLLSTLTWDQGSELAWHRDITASLDMQVYFCDPHSPLQRGTNENTNGLLRQYFPKGTDLSAYSQDYLDAVADELNDRPRKTLDWAKPSEHIIELLNTMQYAQ